MDDASWNALSREQQHQHIHEHCPICDDEIVNNS